MGPALKVGVVGAGPAGLALALLAARWLPRAQVTVYDARPATRDVEADPRTLALSLGSVQLLQRLQAWPADRAEPILHVHVSQAPAPDGPAVNLHAADEGVPMLGAVLSYGALVSALQRAFEAEAARAPQRLALRLGTAVSSVSTRLDGADIHVAGPARDVDLGNEVHESQDIAVIAEGGVYGDQTRKPITRDYGQTAWVGTAELAGAPIATAFERFTRDGPLALLPLPSAQAGGDAGVRRAAIAWCVSSAEDPVRSLDPEGRIALMQSLLPAAAGHLRTLSPLASFALGLNAERQLVQGRRVRIGNAAQTLHPVAGQGLNLALRDVHELMRQVRDAESVPAALRGFERSRAADRWSTLAVTDVLARAFTWRWPMAGVARSVGLSALEGVWPLKSVLARQMMFGMR